MIYDFQRLLCRRLLAWSGLSITGGVYLMAQGDSFWRSFGLQAAAWGLIDALIAALGMRGLDARIKRKVDLAQERADSDRLRKILWINAGLDVVYMAVGVGIAYTLGQNDPGWRGTGWGIVAQGAFLCMFDSLHALAVPDEIILPDLGFFDAPYHQPFHLPGSNGWTAVLVHGFPGTPAEMRDLGSELHQRGWTVEGVLLPGFGHDYTHMFLQRTDGWIEAIAQAVQRHQQAGQKVMLVGFSMGGGLSASAAALAAPERLALLSPFWFDENLATHALVWLVRLALPAAIRPFRNLRMIEDMLQAGASKSAPEIDLSAPEIRAGMRSLRVPLVFLEQLREIGFRIKQVYPRVDGPQVPTLVTRGGKDPIVRRRGTRRLAALTGGCFVEVPGEHHIYIAADPAYPEALKTILDFAKID